jgi:receptor protein-tyrosine kinase
MTGEDFITITANSGSATQAAQIANGFAHQFVASLGEEYSSRITDAITTLNGEIAKPATAGPAGQIARDGLIGQLEQLDLDRKVPTTVAQQVNPALPPSVPSAPKPTRNAIYALLISLVGAIALCFGLERFDRRLKTPEDIEAAFALPVLAVLPHSADPAPVTDGAVLGSDFRESFRSLRTSIELASVDAPPRVIVVTSAMPGEGKSTVVRNLALALCEGGKRVVVVDLDLRNPSLGKLFRVWTGPGFTDVLRGSVRGDVAIHPIATSLPTIEEFVSRNGFNGGGYQNGNGNGHVNGNGHRRTDLRLGFVLAGTRPANPPAVLSSERTTDLLDQLKDLFDVVLIDSAPVLAVTDTVPLLRYADATVFVGRFGVTSRDTVKRLRDFLARVPDVNVLGVVANELPRLDATSYGYGYGYGRNDDGGDRTGLRRRASAGDAGGRQKQTV